MQGSILYIDENHGFVQGVDQNRYYFTDTDWRGNSMPQAGQPVSFQPDGQSAREVWPQVVNAGWGNAPATPGGAPDYNGSRAAYGQAAAQTMRLKSVYNIPLAISALFLLITLVSPYGYSGIDYRFVDTGLQGFYFVLPVVLIVVSLLGLPKLCPLIAWVFCVVATGASLIDDDSLFSRVGDARDQVGRLSAAAGSILNSQVGDEIRERSPSVTQFLEAGFYLHIVALLATGVLVLFFRYEVRAGRVQLEGLGEIDTSELTRAGRDFVAGAERLTGQSVPTGQQTGNFFRSFLTFEKMIAPTIITIIYYINLIFAVFAGIGLIFSGLFLNDYGGGLIAFYGLLVLVFGPLWARVLAEFFIVIFKIHGHLKQIDEKTAR